MAEDTPAHENYLSSLSPKDKPWEVHRESTDRVRELYREAQFEEYSKRMYQCSRQLEFALVASDESEFAFRLRSAHFCRCRHCPVCQWRRSLMWRARFFEALPNVHEAYPTVRWVFLTLTVRNCPLEDLRATLGSMGAAWNRFSRLKTFPALGWTRSVEVTRGIDGTAHPHYHCLLAVPAGYFGKGYLKQSDWTELWRKALRVDYTPIVNVKAIKAKPSANDTKTQEQLFNAVCETLKYTVKEQDLKYSSEWLATLTNELHNTRAIATGGILKEFLKEDKEDLINVGLDDDKTVDDSVRVYFGWRERLLRYERERFDSTQ